MAKAKSKQTSSSGVELRDLTPAQRRERFLAAKKEMSDDWRVVKENETEELVPFDLLPLDYGLRLYGLARKGRVYQFHGDEGAGKSSLAYAVNRNYQKQTKEPIAIFDFERTTTSDYLRKVGINEHDAFIKQPDSVEGCIKDVIRMIEAGCRMFTFDSIPRMHSMADVKEILNGNAMKVQPGTHARAIQQFYNILLPHIARVDGTFLMINQTRSRIEMSQEAQSAAKGYETVTNLNYILPGGKSNRYNVSVMVELKLRKAWRPGKVEDPFLLEPEALKGEEYLANEVRVRSLKNKASGTGYRESTIWIRPGVGVDENISIRQLGRDLGFIAFHGKKWFVGESIDQAIKVYDSKDAAIKELVIDQNPDILQPLKNLIIAKFESDPSIGSIEVDDEEQRYLAGETSDNTDEVLPSTPESAAIIDEL